jgi:hypothetical protein
MGSNVKQLVGLSGIFIGVGEVVGMDVLLIPGHKIRSHISITSYLVQNL